MMSRRPSPIGRAIVPFVILAFPVSVGAAVTDIALKDLFVHSDLVVVARVSKVEDGPAEIRSTGKIATAQVLETWKGNSGREIRFIASPIYQCDMSGAEEGERVVLFLEERRDSPYLISHLGRGRMPLHDANDNRYATLADEVVLPEGTPTIPRTKTARVVLPTKVTGKPERPVTLKYTVRAIELGSLRKLAKEALRSSRPASP